jgi:hypothetical protein
MPRESRRDSSRPPGATLEAAGSADPEEGGDFREIHLRGYGNSKTLDAYSADCPTRQILDRVGDKRAVLILFLVRDEPMRFNALRRTIEGNAQCRYDAARREIAA